MQIRGKNEPFYNIKILRSFVLYLRNELKFSDDKIAEIFIRSGSHVSLIERDDNWFNQEFSDRFYAEVVAQTGDVEIGKRVGHYASRDSFSKGLVGRIALAALNPATVFKSLNKFARHYSRGSNYDCILAKAGHVIIRSVPALGCEEKIYQCQNRIGMLEAIPLSFGGMQVITKHDVCFHKGAKYCEYEIRWRESFRRHPIRNSLLSFGLTLLALLPISSLVSSIAFSFLLALSVYAFEKRWQLNEALRNIEEHKEGLEESIRVIERRRDENLLVSQVIRATSEMRPLNELFILLTEEIKYRMGYDRVVLLMVDDESQTVKVKASVGFEHHLDKQVKLAQFNIREENDSGYLIRVVNSKKPLLITDVEASMDQLSPRSQALIKLLGTKSFLAVPILLKQKVVGVLSVENKSAGRQLTVNDMELLHDISDHMAIAISNAQAFEELKELYQKALVLEGRERNARELFQKFVPSEIVESGGELLEERLTFLKNRLVTVMFTDIQGFTALSEKLRPDEVAEVVSVYIRCVNERIQKFGGRINKVIGDGLLIYFDPQEFSALSAGWEILRAVEEINEEIEQKIAVQIAVGIGVHQGVCSLGSIGYSKRLDYTLIGDAVNTASRIQDFTRQTGANTLCFSSTLLHEAKNLHYGFCGRIMLKGKKDEVEVYQLLSQQLPAHQSNKHKAA